MKAVIAFEVLEKALRAVDRAAQRGFSHAAVQTMEPRREVRDARRRRGRAFSDRPQAGASWSSLDESGRAAEDSPNSVLLARSEAGG